MSSMTTDCTGPAFHWGSTKRTEEESPYKPTQVLDQCFLGKSMSIHYFKQDQLYARQEANIDEFLMWPCESAIQLLQERYH